MQFSALKGVPTKPPSASQQSQSLPHLTVPSCCYNVFSSLVSVFQGLLHPHSGGLNYMSNLSEPLKLRSGDQFSCTINLMMMMLSWGNDRLSPTPWKYVKLWYLTYNTQLHHIKVPVFLLSPLALDDVRSAGATFGRALEDALLRELIMLFTTNFLIRLLSCLRLPV